MPAIPGYAHLAQDAGYRSGRPRVAAAGVSVYAIWRLYRDGWSAERINQQYAALSLGAVFSALAYAVDHQDEMKAYQEEEDRDLAEAMKNYTLPPKIKAALERNPILPGS